jgi:hypothetical protein
MDPALVPFRLPLLASLASILVSLALCMVTEQLRLQRKRQQRCCRPYRFRRRRSSRALLLPGLSTTVADWVRNVTVVFGARLLSGSLGSHLIHIDLSLLHGCIELKLDFLDHFDS